MLVGASAVWLAEPRSGEKWPKQSSRVERRRDFVMAVSSSFQKLLLLIKRVRRLVGVALGGFPTAEPRCSAKICVFAPRGMRGILVEEALEDSSALCETQKNPSALSLIENLANWPGTNRRRPHPKGCPATTVVPPAIPALVGGRSVELSYELQLGSWGWCMC